MAFFRINVKTTGEQRCLQILYISVESVLKEKDMLALAVSEGCAILLKATIAVFRKC